MSSRIALFLAVLFHVGFKVLVFMDPPAASEGSEGCCSLELNFRTVLFLSSVIMFLSRCRIFPPRYRKLPESVKTLVEFIIFLLVIEMAMILLWCRIQTILFLIFDCLVTKQTAMMYADMGGHKLVVFLTTFLSVLTFVYTAMATGYVDWGEEAYEGMCQRLQSAMHRFRKPQCAQTTSSLIDTCTDSSLMMDSTSTVRSTRQRARSSSRYRAGCEPSCPRRRRSRSRRR
ncbi:uncharacterized protein LOC129747191 [Uranotaenia lowii]|uniref:uncharacterized protein LOC129747191 n=1 Tax=Uranotaenia lowii TaxID=190385 RepID=UPI0024791011|nr:uncharacterized protein LOC129747191 [Uranotaenia lowii]